MPIHHLRTEADYNQFMATNSRNSVVIDFFATWCGPCKLLSPQLEQWSKQYPTVVFAKVDVDENEEITSKNKVRAMPTLFFYKNGQKVADIQGYDVARIERSIRGLIN
jgi:thioredoxin 1